MRVFLPIAPPVYSQQSVQRANYEISRAFEQADARYAKPEDLTDFLEFVAAPASAGATGTAGQIAYDTDYIYVCVAADTWKRAALSTW